MLVLSRKVGESIIIGRSKDIEIKILKVEGASVKIGIIAPSDVRIYREEVYRKVAEQNLNSNVTGTFEVSGIFKQETGGGSK